MHVVYYIYIYMLCIIYIYIHTPDLVREVVGRHARLEGELEAQGQEDAEGNREANLFLMLLALLLLL